jgi:hypothetical protein
MCKKIEIRATRITHGGNGEFLIRFFSKKLNGRDHLRSLRVFGKIIFLWIFENYCGILCSAFLYLMTESGSGLV